LGTNVDVIRFILNVSVVHLRRPLTGLGWLLGGALLAITIVGLPYAGAAFRIAGFAFWPFGKDIVHREVTGPRGHGHRSPGLRAQRDLVRPGGLVAGPGPPVAAVAEAVTIIGIPFAIKDLQLAYGRHRPDRPDGGGPALEAGEQAVERAADVVFVLGQAVTFLRRRSRLGAPSSGIATLTRS
jgi:uncharacterized membrane protein YccF (DUF307 family)